MPLRAPSLSRFLPSRRTALCVAAGALSLATLGARAQTYPDHPITVVVPFSAGGDADLAARILSVAAQKLLGQTLVISNRAGAVASQAVRTAKPDGYTLLLGRVGSQVVLPALQNPPPHQWNDFTLLGLLELNPVVCAVRSERRTKPWPIWSRRCARARAS